MSKRIDGKQVCTPTDQGGRSCGRGSRIRRSHDKKKGLEASHLVSVWLTYVGLTLAQVSTEEKSNETTAIPEVLRLVDTNGAIITIDAMGTQTAIAEQIVDGGGDYGDEYN